MKKLVIAALVLAAIAAGLWLRKEDGKSGHVGSSWFSSTTLKIRATQTIESASVSPATFSAGPGMVVKITPLNARGAVAVGHAKLGKHVKYASPKWFVAGAVGVKKFRFGDAEIVEFKMPKGATSVAFSFQNAVITRLGAVIKTGEETPTGGFEPGPLKYKLEILPAFDGQGRVIDLEKVGPLENGVFPWLASLDPKQLLETVRSYAPDYAKTVQDANAARKKSKEKLDEMLVPSEPAPVTKTASPPPPPKNKVEEVQRGLEERKNAAIDKTADWVKRNAFGEPEDILPPK
ncbi:MAG: hypothetical protein PHU73_01285 [Patescibacteria group bacterium]|nr:hypothetical protein [Patescibacteria group bacterium]